MTKQLYSVVIGLTQEDGERLIDVDITVQAGEDEEIILPTTEVLGGCLTIPEALHAGITTAQTAIFRHKNKARDAGT